VKVSNFQVIWVNDIIQHLTLTLREPDITREDSTLKIRIFHHRTFLNFHADRKSTIFPEGFVEETLRNLDLLLPYQHVKTRRWYQVQAKNFKLDNNACLRGKGLSAHFRKIESFRFWRERLTLPKEAYDQLEPDTVSRFWLDKRNPVQWAIFWVAVLVLVLTVFFGLVQSIEGALQVYRAYYPLG
jgi:hypothetical protein